MEIAILIGIIYLMSRSKTAKTPVVGRGKVASGASFDQMLKGEKPTYSVGPVERPRTVIGNLDVM